MPKQLSAVTIASPREAPDQFFLMRTDFPEVDRVFVWCGRALGWQPMNSVTRLLRHLYPSMQAAEKAAERYVTWPAGE